MITIQKSGGQSFVMGTGLINDGIVQNIKYSISTNNISLPIPDEAQAWIMSLGGISGVLDITYTTIMHSKLISNIMNVLMTGRMFSEYYITVDEWNIYRLGCVINDVEIVQDKGTDKVDVTLKILVGKVI